MQNIEKVLTTVWAYETKKLDQNHNLVCQHQVKTPIPAYPPSLSPPQLILRFLIISW